MKRIAVFFAALLISNSIIADVRPEHSGAWYNPTQSGHGFSIDVISPQRSLAFWYAYDPFGEPIFLYAEGVNVGNQIQAQVYFLYGMVWGEFNPDTNNMLNWGTLTITFHDCSNATLQYDSVLEYQTGEAFGSGQMPLVHLASIEGFRCVDYPMSGIYSGFARSERYGDTVFGYGIVNGSGQLNFISEDGVIVNGQMSLTGGTSGSMYASGRSVYYVAGVSVVNGTFSANGHFTPDIIGADYNASATGDYGFIEAHKLQRATNSAVSMTDIAGNWVAFNLLSGLSQAMTINSSGSFSVTDQFGCQYNGQVSIPNPDVSILDVTANVTGCNLASGTYTGNGAFLRNELIYNNGDDVIYIVGWNEQNEAAVMRLTPN